MADTQKADDVVQQEILKVAIQLYQKFGPDKVTMDDVANATGRSRSSLYYYFKNRDDIFQAVLDTVATDVAAKIRVAVAKANTLTEKFCAFGLSKLKASDEWKSILNAMWLAMDADGKSKHGKTMESLHTKLIRHEGIIIREILLAAKEQNKIRAITPAEQDTLVFIIYSGVRGIRNEINVQHNTQDLKPAMQLLAEMIVRWLTD